MQKAFIGIDPGKKGAMAVYQNGEVIFAEPLHHVGDELDILHLMTIISGVRQTARVTAVLEKVHAMPGQGVCSMFTFGKGYGEIRGMLKAAGIPIIEPTPQAWKKKVLAGMDHKGNKAASCEYVMRAHPNVSLTPGKTKKPHDGIADAVCLAVYGAGEAGHA